MSSSTNISKRALQAVNAILAAWILFRAGLTLFEGTANPLYGAAGVPDLPVLDSNLRFLGGVGVAFALVLLWITPGIGRYSTVFRVIWGCRFFGGIGRVISILAVGAPPTPVLIFTVSEVLLIPILVYWQWAVARAGATNAT